MGISFKSSAAPFLFAALAIPGWASLSAQEQAPAGEAITVTGMAPTDLAGLPEGPDIEGQITALGAQRNRCLDESAFAPQ